MPLSEKQQKVLNWIRQNGSIRTAEAIAIIGTEYNPEKYAGETLSRMVKARLISRIKPGHFGPFVGKPVEPDFKLEAPE